jgi:hypothetical protein
MPIPNDTSPEIERKQIELLRAVSPESLFMRAARFTSDSIRSSKAAIAEANPSLSTREVGYLFVELHYGKELANLVRIADQKRRHATVV